MASWSTIRIGETQYGGSQRYINDSQAQLFNNSDLVAIGEVGQPGFARLYRITVGELRARLEALGYTLAQVRDDIKNALSKSSTKRTRVKSAAAAAAFSEYLRQVTIDQLLDLVRSWKRQDRQYDLESVLRSNLNDFPAALLDFVQGGSVDLLEDDRIWIQGHHFERLLCEVHADDEYFELDFSGLVAAGYYAADEAPLGDPYDEQLASVTPNAFRIGQALGEEESDTLEFKSVEGANPCKSISSMLARYAIGFLNRNGGRLLVGVCDDGRVSGVALSRQDRDELQRQVNAVCATIIPVIPLGALRISYHPIIGAGRQLDDRFVVEIEIQRGRPREMYFKPSGETWVRMGTETRSLKGHELFIHVCVHYSQADALVTALSDRARIAAEEVDRLRLDGELHQGVVASKEQEVEELKQALTTVNELMDETNLVCPECRAPLTRRESFPIHGYIGGREVEADVEYREYECGYSVREDQAVPLSTCNHTP